MGLQHKGSHGLLREILTVRRREGSSDRVRVCFDSQEPPPTKDMRKLVEDFNDESTQLILECDSNAYHIVCGNTGINKRGESLPEFIITNE